MVASIERESVDRALRRCVDTAVPRKRSEMEAKEAEVSLATLRNTQASCGGRNMGDQQKKI